MSYLSGEPEDAGLSGATGAASISGWSGGAEPIIALRENARSQAGGVLAQLAVVDDWWNILTVNGAWSERALRADRSDQLEIGANLKHYVQQTGDLSAETAAALLEGMRLIETRAQSQFAHSYCSRIDQAHYQVTIDCFEVGGRRYATVARANLTELFDLRARAMQLSSNLMRAQASLVRAQEEERRRVAAALHDTAAQHLVGVNLGLARLREMSQDPAVVALADELSTLLDDFHREIRGVTYVMHPPEIRRRGLHEAVRLLCQGFARRTGLDIALRIYGEDRRRGTAVEAAIFRLVQEALANIQKHAGAKRVQVRLGSRAKSFFIVIHDDGVGLPVGAGQAATGVGLPAMERRIEDLGGRLHLESRKARRGTTVAAMIPRHEAGLDFLPGPMLRQPAGAA
ncbi:histidine kinase [Sphingomonas sp. HITSZ_GF]|uniref:sensor histidine kinase n=1 Tax=Sphingomonas sp. HITSZ_GF TaxID=3037247 RepID=UPI00240E2690|nr:ATP-binding protein [Sphingomonas sp. HITSZ_GF]MDG2534155.1 histidine kinase [Sphingomonas sp. HITSZ_GF]